MKTALRFTFVLALTAALLFVWLRALDGESLLASLSEADPLLLVLAGLAGLLHVPARALRWRALLDVGGPLPPFRELVLTTAVGYFITFLIPGRIGEVVRPALLSRRSEVPLGASLASVLFERLLDVGVLVLLLVSFLILSPELASEKMRQVATWLTVAGVLGLSAGVFAHRRWRSEWDLLISSLARRLPGRVGKKAERLGLTALRGFDSLLKPGAWWRLGLLSFLTWLPCVACYALTLVACSAMSTWTAPLLLTVAGAFGIAIPTPAGIGGFEAVVTHVLESILHVEPTRAAAAALLIHVSSVLPVFFLGLYYFLREGLSMKALKSAAAAAEPEPEPEPEPTTGTESPS
jgi:uncharacterized protein (TIRG00374 family)